MFRTLLTCSLSKKNSFSTSVFDVVNLFGPFGDVLLCGGGFMVPTMRVAGICCRLNARPQKADFPSEIKELVVTTRNPPPCDFACGAMPTPAQLGIGFARSFNPIVGPTGDSTRSSSAWLCCLGFLSTKKISVFLFQVWKIPGLKVKTFLPQTGEDVCFMWDLSKIARESGFFWSFLVRGGFGIEIPSIKGYGITV